jgi:proline iminopeptidase
MKDPMPAIPPSLFPPILPNRHGMLAVDDLHTIYWEEVGNPHGIPVIFLHGGPGAGLSPQHRRFSIRRSTA